MLKNLCKRTVDFLLAKQLLNPARKDWYLYALESRVSTCLGIVCMLCTGMVISGFWATVFLLLGIMPLRRRLSGYHASTPTRCFFLSLGVVVIAMKIAETVIAQHAAWVIWTIFSFCCFAAAFLLPFNHPQLYQSFAEVQANHKRAQKILLVQLIGILLLSVLLPKTQAAIYCATGVITAVISFLIAKVKKEVFYARENNPQSHLKYSGESH